MNPIKAWLMVPLVGILIVVAIWERIFNGK